MSKTKKSAPAAFLSLAVALLLSACGQKGPLYLPPKAALIGSPCQALESHTITDRQSPCRAA
jgi:predicted small lipoprotein YifL